MHGVIGVAINISPDPHEATQGQMSQAESHSVEEQEEYLFLHFPSPGQFIPDKLSPPRKVIASADKPYYVMSSMMGTPHGGASYTKQTGEAAGRR